MYVMTSFYSLFVIAKECGRKGECFDFSPKVSTVTNATRNVIINVKMLKR